MCGGSCSRFRGGGNRHPSPFDHFPSYRGASSRLLSSGGVGFPCPSPRRSGRVATLAAPAPLPVSHIPPPFAALLSRGGLSCSAYHYPRPASRGVLSSPQLVGFLGRDLGCLPVTLPAPTPTPSGGVVGLGGGRVLGGCIPLPSIPRPCGLLGGVLLPLASHLIYKGAQSFRMSGASGRLPFRLVLPSRGDGLQNSPPSEVCRPSQLWEGRDPRPCHGVSIGWSQ